VSVSARAVPPIACICRWVLSRNPPPEVRTLIDIVCAELNLPLKALDAVAVEEALRRYYEHKDADEGAGVDPRK
jgi:hypothetical protein